MNLRRMISNMKNPLKFFWSLTIFLACQIVALPALAKPTNTHNTQGAAHAPQTAAPSPVSTSSSDTKHSPYMSKGGSAQTNMFYQSTWGIENPHLKRTASGNLIRFSYRVVDVERAKILGDKQATPQLIDLQRGVSLQIPEMENVGQLRQTGIPIAGREYWMVFSNKGDVVKVGDRADVVIGVFHSDGLVVE